PAVWRNWDDFKGRFDHDAEVAARMLAAAQSALPGFTMTEAERKEREGRVYFDVEGVRADGGEAEIDVLQTP
ncbi:MAG TPA: hypothetical protein PLS69_05905, partial [Terricaulis sp.]|nr:hypothetical protein [Terricaulis sp.]